MNEGQALWIALTASVTAIISGIIFALEILKQPDGNEKMREIAGAIQEGAKAYLNRQYLTIGIVGIVIFLLLGFSGIGWLCAIAFGYHFVFQPVIIFVVALVGIEIPELPEFDMGTLLTVLGGMLGIGGLRTYEKQKGLTK